jgi:streptogramin lyase
MKKSHLSLFFGLSLAWVAAVVPVRAQDRSAVEAPGIMGAVMSKAGKALAGVTVSARATDQTMTTSVYTDEKGAYVFPHLTAGTYKVWAQSVGFTTLKADLKLDGSHTASRNLTLQPLADFGQQLTGYEWFSSLPDDTAEHKRMKQVMYVACTGCHSLDLALQNRFDEKGWNAVIKAMENSFYNGYRPGDFNAQQLRWEGQIIRHHREDLAKYLAEVRGPDSKPLALKPQAPVTGDAARVVVTEYELPVKEQLDAPSWYTGSDWMLGPSTGMHGIVGIHDVIADRDGTAWITQARTTFETNRSIVKLDPKTGAMTSIAVRAGGPNLIYFEQIAQPDVNGDIWMHDGANMVRLTPKTETFASFRIPQVMGGMNNSTDADSKGRGVANARSGVVRFDTSKATEKGVQYPGWELFQQNTPGDGVTYGISADAEDNIWWSESYVDKVAVRDGKTGKVTEFDMRDPEYDARKALMTPADLKFYENAGAGTWANNSISPLPYMTMPRRLAADKKGDTVWVPLWAQASIVEINIHTHKVTYHHLPIMTHPYKTTVDRDHNVWTDSGLADSIFRFTPSSQTWTQFRLPSHGCGSRHMSFDDVKGEAWLPCDQSNKVARFQFRSPADLAAAQAAARR